jgi:hypothetical protein
VPSKHLLSITEHGGEEPLLQHSPMCSVWMLTTYDACDIRCSYCASYAQGPSKPRASADQVRDLLEEQLPAIPDDQAICLGGIIDCYPHAGRSTRSPAPRSRCSWPTTATSSSSPRAP